MHPRLPGVAATPGTNGNTAAGEPGLPIEDYKRLTEGSGVVGVLFMETAADDTGIEARDPSCGAAFGQTPPTASSD